MKLNGPQKAAILLLTLGEEHAQRLFSRLHEDEIKDVSAAMATLGAVDATAVEELCQEFSDSLGATGKLIGSYETTERMLLKTLPPDRVAQIMEEIR